MTTPDNFIELEMDVTPTTRKIVPSIPEDQIELDLVDRLDPTCRRCSGRKTLNVEGYCQSCFAVKTTESALPVAPVSDFASIAAESSANAGQSNLGELANGRATLGVGFHNADGYVTALRRGVLAHTRAEYEQTLKTRYGFTAEAVAAIGAVTIDQSLPVGDGITHNADANLDSAVAAIKASAKKGIAAAKGLSIIADTATERHAPTLRHGEVFAGAVAEGHGILTHWTGSGPLTVAEITEIAAIANLPTTWLPRAKDPKTYANHAVTTIARELGLKVSKEKRDWTKTDQSYDHRWRLETSAANAAVGDAAGHVTLVVTLTAGVLTCDGTEIEASEKIAAAYADLQGREVLQAGHITTWLGNLLRDRLDGVKYGGCWYVKRDNRATAEALVSAFSAKWGSDWMNPPTPIATSAQLARGIANGLAAEVDATVAQLDAANATCVANKGEKGLGHIGERAAATFLKEFRAHAERVKTFAALLGPALVAESRIKVETATAKINEYTDDPMGIGERFAAVWDEIEFDAAKAGEELPE